MRFQKLGSGTMVLISIMTISACTSSAPASYEAPLVPNTGLIADATDLPTETPVPAVTTVPNVAPIPTFVYTPKYEPFDPNAFTQPTNIDNQWFPLKPGTQITFGGTSRDNGEYVPRRIIVTVTDLTKVIGGVRTVVTMTQDFSSDELVEGELSFYAQDHGGTVWYLGEYPEEYDQGQITKVPAWIHGIQGAAAGILMPGNPKLGMPDYSEGWGPAVGWADRGRVEQMGQKTCTQQKCYDNVLEILESSGSEQGAYQVKYYAPGLGEIKTGWEGRDKTQETLELTDRTQLSPEALAEVRVQALKLDASGYKMSKDVYALTSPAE